MKRGSIYVIAIMFVVALGAIGVGAASRSVTIRVTGMTCPGCARTIEQALQKTEGVMEARVNFERGEAWIRYDDRKVGLARLRGVINSTGYRAAEIVRSPSKGNRRS